MRPNDLMHAQGCYSSSAPSEGSSVVSTFESRFMLMAWISAIRSLPCNNGTSYRSAMLCSSCPAAQRSSISLWGW